MIIRAIKDLTNSRLAGEQLTYSQLLPYFDAVVDDINARLHTQFAVFSEVTTTDTSLTYTEFPDKYIRTVVCVGAAYKWYVDDEEGIATAEALGQEFENNLFLMERDYGPLIPNEKRRDDKGGMLPEYGCEHNQNYWNPNIRYIEQAGYAGASVTNLEIREKDGSRHLIATITDQVNGSKKVDCGVVSPNVAAFQLDAKGDIVVLMSDGTTYKAGGNLLKLIMNALLKINPIVSLEYTGYQFIATLLNDDKIAIGEFYSTPNAKRMFTVYDNSEFPEDAKDGDILFKIKEV